MHITINEIHQYLQKNDEHINNEIPIELLGNALTIVDTLSKVGNLRNQGESEIQLAKLSKILFEAQMFLFDQDAADHFDDLIDDELRE